MRTLKYNILAQSLMLIVLFFKTPSVFAENDAINNMINANDAIVNYSQAITQAQTISQVTVEVPMVVPKLIGGKKLFAHMDRKSQQYGFDYMIYVDSTSTCHGVKYCNIGIIAARKTDKIDTMKNRKNKIITKQVMLSDGTNAYFTPGHAMGDFVPATIQWLDKKTVYMISWSAGKISASQMREILITMANSAKHPGSN